MINQWTQCQNILQILHDFWSGCCFCPFNENWKLNERKKRSKNTEWRQNKNDYRCLISACTHIEWSQAERNPHIWCCVAHALGTFGCFHREREEKIRWKKKKADAIFHLFLLFVLSAQNDDVFECVCMSFAKNVFLLLLILQILFNSLDLFLFCHLDRIAPHCEYSLYDSPRTNDWYGGISQMGEKNSQNLWKQNAPWWF